MSSNVKVQVIRVISHGLETFQVWYDRTLVSSHMAESTARFRANDLARRLAA